jgi:hypothetical protein
MGSRTCDLAACSIVHQPSMLPRDPIIIVIVIIHSVTLFLLANSAILIVGFSILKRKAPLHAELVTGHVGERFLDRPLKRDFKDFNTHFYPGHTLIILLFLFLLLLFLFH